MCFFVSYSAIFNHWSEINIESQYIMVHKGQKTCLDCMFCFPKVGHVISMCNQIVTSEIRE